MKSPALALLMLTSSAAVLAAAEGTAPPAGVEVVDWNGIRAEYLRHKRAVVAGAEAGIWRFRGPEWTGSFDGRGVELRSTEEGGAWRWGLRLASYGRASAASPVRVSGLTPAPHADVEKFAYQWNADLREWYVNGPAGAFEHGYTLARAPEGPESKLEFRIEILGDLESRAIDGGKGVAFYQSAASTTPLLNYAGLKVIDATGRELPSRMTAANGTLTIAVDDAGARYPVTIDPTVTQVAYLKPAAVGTSQAGDQFGYSLAISGDTVVVGVPYEPGSGLGVNSYPDEGSHNAGAVYVFRRSRLSGWVQEAYLKPNWVGFGQSGDNFGYSVAIDGDILVVGAPLEDSDWNSRGRINENASNAGAVYVFVRTNGVWAQEAFLKPRYIVAQSWFGWSVSVSGNAVAAAAPNHGLSGLGVNPPPGTLTYPSPGAAWIFRRSVTPSTGVAFWTEEAYLKPDVPQWYFGSSLALDKGTAIVAAQGQSSAIVYYYNGSTWSVQARLPAPGILQVAIDGDLVAIAHGGPPQTYLRVWAGGIGYWIDGGKAELPAPTVDYRVAVRGNRLAVGYLPDASSTTGVNSTPNANAPDSGAVLLYTRLQGPMGVEIRRNAYIKPEQVGSSQEGDGLGYSLAMSDTWLVAGTRGEDGSATGVNGVPDERATDAGAAYVWSLSPQTVPITLNTNPTGWQFRVTGAGCAPGDAATYTAPATMQWVIGSYCKVEILMPPQPTFPPINGISVTWENGLMDAVRTIVTPSTPATYTARILTLR